MTKAIMGLAGVNLGLAHILIFQKAGKRTPAKNQYLLGNGIRSCGAQICGSAIASNVPSWLSANSHTSKPSR